MTEAALREGRERTGTQLRPALAQRDAGSLLRPRRPVPAPDPAAAPSARSVHSPAGGASRAQPGASTGTAPRDSRGLCPDALLWRPQRRAGPVTGSRPRRSPQRCRPRRRAASGDRGRRKERPGKAATAPSSSLLRLLPLKLFPPDGTGTPGNPGPELSVPPAIRPRLPPL